MRDILHWPALTLPFISPEPSFSSYSCPQFTTSLILVLIITYSKSHINLGLLAPTSLILIFPCQDFDHTESYSHNQILNYIPRLPPPSPIYQSTEVIGMFLYPSYQLFFLLTHFESSKPISDSLDQILDNILRQPPPSSITSKLKGVWQMEANPIFTTL